IGPDHLGSGGDDSRRPPCKASPLVARGPVARSTAGSVRIETLSRKFRPPSFGSGARTVTKRTDLRLKLDVWLTRRKRQFPQSTGRGGLLRFNASAALR